MPPDRPLPEVDIRLIETWILDGAIDDRAVAVAGEGGGGGESAAVAPAATVDLQVPPDAQAPGD
jgi:hypothetical protein